MHSLRSFFSSIGSGIAAITALALCSATCLASPAVQPKLEARFGIVAYQDLADDLEYYNKLALELTQRSKVPLHIQVAAGTYGDVLHWMEREYIDVALVTPGLVADLLAREKSGEPLPWSYMASELRSLAGNAPSADGASTYSALAVARNGSPLTGMTDVRKAAERGELEVLAVDPLSVSGFIAPLHALRMIGVSLANARVNFTHSHANSLRFLADAAAQSRIAFVWDGELKRQADKARFKVLSFPELDGLKVPLGALIGRTGSPQLSIIQPLITALRPADFKIERAWRSLYEPIIEWRKDLPLAAERELGVKVSLPEISASLIQHARSQPVPPRLAVVLAGGGAKCSFQVGALRAIEEELLSAREITGIADIDIKLVVGTSGGAINALPAALGISATQAGYADFAEAWRDLDRREIIAPTFAVRLNMSLWLAALEALFLLTLTRFMGRGMDELGIPVVPALVLGAAQLALGYYNGKPWRFLGSDGTLHNVWLWFTYGFKGAGIALLALGLLTFLSRYLSRMTVIRFVPSARGSAYLLLLLVAGLPALQAWTILWKQETLSENTGIEAAFARNFGRLISGECQRRGQTCNVDDAGSTPALQLKALGREILKKNLLLRDVVLTASPIGVAGPGALSGDLYFYAAASGSSPAQRFGALGVSLQERPALIFDALMGSGAIYPLFPARRLNDFPGAGKSTELVDGSFAHRSPIEAAVLWGATHIILIEAATDEAVQRGNLMHNIAAALSYLYDQAQLTDVRARGQVTIFSLVPRTPHLGILDFSDNLISAGIEKGYREANGRLSGSVNGVGVFRKELGRPQFWDPIKLINVSQSS